jgi:hypothetical protein
MPLAQLRAHVALRSLAAALGGLVLVLAAVLPATAAGPVKLDQPSVSDRSVTSGTIVQFAVRYRNLSGETPAAVTVLVGTQRFPMQPSDGTPTAATARDGVRFSTAARPAVGAQKVTFEATDQKGRQATVAGGTISVAAPTGGGSGPAPTPRAQPTPAPTPRIPAPTPAMPTPAAPTLPERTGPTDDIAVPPLVPAATIPLPIRIDGGPGAPAGADPLAPARLLPAAPGRAIVLSGDDGGIAVEGTGTASGGASGQAVPGLEGRPGTASPFEGLPGILAPAGPSPIQTAVGVTVTTAGGAAMAMAFMLFGKRRRDGQPTADEATLQAAAATVGAEPTAGVVLPPGEPSPALPPEAELAVPRWRRASLLEARKADPTRAPLGPVVSLTFASGAVTPVAGHECRTIRYRVVRLLDRPDELLAQEVGVLDQNDEVQLLERSGPYWRVLCPDGRQGWLHRMTLGDVVDPAAAPSPMPPVARPAGPGWADPYAGRLAAVGAGAAAPTPAPAQHQTAAYGDASAAGTVQDDLDDVDPDVLEAFLASVGRA